MGNKIDEGYGPGAAAPKSDMGKAAYPWPGGSLDLSNEYAVQQYLASFNKAMADVGNGVLHDQLLAGMAGFGDMRSGETGYALPTPNMDHAPAKMSLQGK